MEMLNTLVEAVFISFLIGAIMGGVVVAHFVTRGQTEETGKLQPIKIRSDRDNG
jgi:hypothetical protein